MTCRTSPARAQAPCRLAGAPPGASCHLSSRAKRVQRGRTRTNRVRIWGRWGHLPASLMGDASAASPRVWGAARFPHGASWLFSDTLRCSLPPPGVELGFHGLSLATLDVFLACPIIFASACPASLHECIWLYLSLHYILCP